MALVDKLQSVLATPLVPAATVIAPPAGRTSLFNGDDAGIGRCAAELASFYDSQLRDAEAPQDVLRVMDLDADALDLDAETRSMVFGSSLLCGGLSPLGRSIALVCAGGAPSLSTQWYNSGDFALFYDDRAASARAASMNSVDWPAVPRRGTCEARRRSRRRRLPWRCGVDGAWCAGSSGDARPRPEFRPERGEIVTHLVWRLRAESSRRLPGRDEPGPACRRMRTQAHAVRQLRRGKVLVHGRVEPSERAREPVRKRGAWAVTERGFLATPTGVASRRRFSSVPYRESRAGSASRSGSGARGPGA